MGLATRPASRSGLLGLALLLTAAPAAPARPEASPPRIEVLGSTDIPAAAADGGRILELSGLAWDGDEGLLYAVSDGGTIHHFALRLDGDRIAELRPVFSGPLSAPGDGSRRGLSNAEGLDVLNGANGQRADAELLVALEDGPAIARFTPQGRYLGPVELPGPLADGGSYDGKNERLESVAAHPRLGVLTAPETPLKDSERDRQTVFATDGRTWSFERSEAKGSDLKAIEVLPDGSLLILARVRAEQGDDRRAQLRHVDLSRCAEGGSCPVADPAASSGELLVGNYEGLARVSDDLFVMVSDHTKKDEAPAKLVLLRFKL